MSYDGMDILPITDDNELFAGLTYQASIAKHQHPHQHPPLPHACVLVAITNESNPKLLLTRRATGLSSHAGEVAFVGGKRDDTDTSSLLVALREAYEEVGLVGAELIGYLPMQFSSKGLLVRPVVVSVAPSVAEELTPSVDEIGRIFWLPLSYLLQHSPTDYVFDRPELSATLHTPAWVVDLDGDGCCEVVWGLTGRMLANLLEIGFGVKWSWYYRLVKR